MGMNPKLKHQSTPEHLAFFQHPEQSPNHNVTESKPEESIQPAKALAIMENQSVLGIQSYWGKKKRERERKIGSS